MNKKYYDGFNVIDILFKNLEPRKMLKVLNEFAESDGVDAVEVVRCKDCKWFNDIGCAISIVDDSDKPKYDDYCSYGERKE